MGVEQLDTKRKMRKKRTLEDDVGGAKCYGKVKVDDDDTLDADAMIDEGGE